MIQAVYVPILLLWWHVRGRRNANVWIDQEQRENLAMSRLAWIHQIERLYAVLQYVRKHHEPAFIRTDTPKILYRMGLVRADAEKLLHVVELKLLVARIIILVF